MTAAPTQFYALLQKSGKPISMIFFLKVYPTQKYFSLQSWTARNACPARHWVWANRYNISGKIKLKIIEKYNQTRDFPAIGCASRLSVHLRFGTISIRQLVSIALQKMKHGWTELVLARFYQMILWHFPRNWERAFKPQYDYVEWRNNENEFKQWCAGQTGYPIVDAGMRNWTQRAICTTACAVWSWRAFSKHLLIDWRWAKLISPKRFWFGGKTMAVGNGRPAVVAMLHRTRIQSTTSNR